MCNLLGAATGFMTILLFSQLCIYCQCTKKHYTQSEENIFVMILLINVQYILKFHWMGKSVWKDIY